jgi:DNA-directed RNA polymerase specialized sigma24 family protein
MCQPGRFGYTIHAVARYEVRQAYARREALPLYGLAEVIAEPDDLIAWIERRDAIDLLRRALDKIAVIYRRVLVAQFLEGEPTRSVAVREGIPLGTVLSRVCRWEAAAPLHSPAIVHRFRKPRQTPPMPQNQHVRIC